MPEIKFQEMGISKKNKANIRAVITMNKIILNAKLYLIRQAGHEVNIEAPEELSNLIEKFWIGNK
jgi:pimeloyl-ACP methyl ester carboxylesterase